MKKFILVVVALVLPAFSGDIENGKEVYKRNCAFCHSIHMTGGMGRDFNLVSYTRTKEQIKFQVSDPHISAFQLGYTSNAMPKFKLSDKDVEDVASFVDSIQPIKEKAKNN
jgi:cytochrome c6